VAEVRTIVVAADPLARGGLAALLDRESELRVVAQLSPDDDVAQAARESDGATVVWDLGAGARPGLEPLAEAARAGATILALVHDEEDALEALAAGARGALTRDADGRRVAAALQAMIQGLRVVDDALADAVLRPAQPAPAVLVEPLTRRESEVLQLLAQGLANKTIAERLGISEHTAKFHVNAILGKLGVQSRTEAIVQAARLGLVIL
jgi:DNA-binding NarL/FixJ family response regulator